MRTRLLRQLLSLTLSRMSKYAIRALEDNQAWMVSLSHIAIEMIEILPLHFD